MLAEPAAAEKYELPVDELRPEDELLNSSMAAIQPATQPEE